MIDLEPKVYWTRLLVEINNTHEDYKAYSGAKGWAFVKSTDAAGALELLKEELQAYNLKSVAFEFIKEYGFEIWEKTESLHYMNSLADKAANSDKMVLSEMFGVEKTEPEKKLLEKA